MPEPVLISIAAALAARTVGGLYDLVKKKFTKDPAASAALDAAAGAAAESPEVHELAEVLERAERTDRVFADALRAEWRNTTFTQHAESGGVTNQISGNVSGKVVQAGTIHGNITL